MRSLVLSNGTLLVGFDAHAQVRDIYFPYIGLENQAGGNLVHRLGVWVDGVLHWFNNGDWDISMDCSCEALIGMVTASNKVLGVKLLFTDVVYNEKNIFIRRIVVKNLKKKKRVITVFFGHEFKLYESDVANTALYDPLGNVIIHYRGKRVFLINAVEGDIPFKEYTTGVFGMEGKEGSYRDAEDGVLSKNPIEHGSADSVVGVSCTYKSGEEKTLHYWFTVASSIEEAKGLNSYVLKKTPEHLIKTTTDFWNAWVNKQELDFKDLEQDIVDLFKKSLFFIRAHVDNHGAIIASTDSSLLQKGKDTYNYMWPRDGAITALALNKSGDANVAERFFTFCNDVIHPHGYFMHKYSPDKSLGSSWLPWVRGEWVQPPIQEDETALVIYSLWENYHVSKDLEFIEKIYNSLIKKAVDFMMVFHDPRTNLPHPTYDLWEEKFGVHTFTAASVYGALHAAAQCARLLGKDTEALKYSTAGDTIKKGIFEHLYDKERHTFIKGITFDTQGGPIQKDTTIDMSSVYGIFTFGVLSADDPLLEKAMQTAKEHLTCNTVIGGIARYEHDHYNRVSTDTPGNPWIITTLWLAQYYIAKAENKEELQKAFDILTWTARHASPSGVLSEQLNPYTGEHISAAPLTWSHSEFVRTVLLYLEKYHIFDHP